MSHAAARQGKIARSRELLKQAERLGESRFGVLWSQAYIMECAGETEAAMSAFGSLASEYPQELVAWTRYYLLADKIRPGEEVIGILVRAGEHLPDSVVIASVLAGKLIAAHRPDEALEVCRRIPARSGGQPLTAPWRWLLMHHGIAQLDVGMGIGAAGSFREILAHEPHDTEATENLAFALRCEFPAESIVLLESVLGLAGTDHEVVCQLGICHAIQGDAEAGRMWLDRAAAKFPASDWPLMVSAAVSAKFRAAGQVPGADPAVGLSQRGASARALATVLEGAARRAPQVAVGELDVVDVRVMLALLWDLGLRGESALLARSVQRPFPYESWIRARFGDAW